MAQFEKLSFCSGGNLQAHKKLFSGWFLKNSYIQIKNLYCHKLERAAKQSELKNIASSTEGITPSSVNYFLKRKSKYSLDLLYS